MKDQFFVRTKFSYVKKNFLPFQKMLIFIFSDVFKCAEFEYRKLSLSRLSILRGRPLVKTNFHIQILRAFFKIFESRNSEFPHTDNNHHHKICIDVCFSTIFLISFYICQYRRVFFIRNNIFFIITCFNEY